MPVVAWPPTARSSAEMTPEAMQIYYSTVDTAEDAVPVDEIAWDEWVSDRSEGAPYGSQPSQGVVFTNGGGSGALGGSGGSATATG